MMKLVRFVVSAFESTSFASCASWCRLVTMFLMMCTTFRTRAESSPIIPTANRMSTLGRRGCARLGSTCDKTNQNSQNRKCPLCAVSARKSSPIARALLAGMHIRHSEWHTLSWRAPKRSTVVLLSSVFELRLVTGILPFFDESIRQWIFETHGRLPRYVSGMHFEASGWEAMNTRVRSDYH